MKKPFIDLAFIKQNADVPTVLEQLQIPIVKHSGNELRIHCPSPDHEDTNASCDINTAEDGKFYCHSCHAKGSILDLVAMVERTDIRAAATAIGEMCAIPLSARSTARSRRGSGLTAKKKPVNKPEPAAEPTGGEPFKPYTTVLKLDTKHSFATERGLTAASIDTFGMGYQKKRGMFKDRWCMPIHDQTGEQLGYMGRLVKKRLNKDDHKWLFPKNFPKQDVLFNLHRVDVSEFGGIILVEGGLDTVRLHGLSHPTLGLLGHSISDRQIELLLDLEIDQVLVMLDGDAAGRTATPTIVDRLASSFYVRNIELPDGEDPETIAEAFLDEHVWWL